ncbi:unnamed protein product [Malus baccata var. baccata]
MGGIMVLLLLIITLHVNLGHGDANMTMRCTDKEKEALLAFKQGLNMDEHSQAIFSSWGTEAAKQDCCRWEGVSCDNQTGHVVHLDLGDHFYSQGTMISPKLIELKHLKYLNLSWIDFGGSQLPYFIGSLTNLRHLDLSGCSFGGKFPIQVGNLTNLQYLDLGFNDFSGNVENLNWLPRLSSLTYLGLAGVNFSGSQVPYFIGSLTNLGHLDLSYCYFGGKFPIQVGNLTNLQYLDLRYSGFRNVENLNWLPNLSSLTHLNLFRCAFGGKFPIQVGNLTNLQYLDLGVNDFGVRNVENLNWLPRLSSLTYLGLSCNNLSNVFYWPEAVNKLPKITDLILAGCSLPSPPVRSTFSNINSSKSLSSIDLSFNRLSTSSIFLWMSNYSASLVDLYLSSNHLTGSIPDVFGNMSSLADVDLYGNQLEGAEPHSFSRLCSVQSLDLRGNNLSGQFSRFVQILPTCAQSSLESLWLGENQLSGRIPESIGQMSKLENLDLGMNALEGLISDSHFSKLSKLSYLDLSSNSLVLNFESNWTPPFQLDYICLGSCKMGPYFPKWLQTQNKYSFLNISNAGIVDILPSWFWGTTRYVTSIDLSHNQIGEMFTNLTMDFVNYPEVHLRSNQIEGQIPATLSNASYLDLSNNNISGSISFLCTSAATDLSFLNLSYNYLSGELPKCLTHLGNLVMLDLSSNALSGKIPSTIGSLFGIETLKLRSNEFVGELPLSLKNCTSLVVLDLADNQLSGSIPKWLGASFQNLVILMLSSNHFNGSLPLQLCDLIHIQILDVSVNNISGGIPNCLKKLTTLAQKGNSSLIVGHYFGVYTDLHSGREEIYEDDEIFIWKGSMQVYRNTLGLVRSIDFSSNRLTGEIPREISHLVGLVSLNLSRNQLTGQITPDIGKLESLDSLDLSRNHIDGRIPTSLARISRLGVLDLSHNNLIGKIPTGTQLQSFDPSFYAGNPQLCGPPLQKPCDIEETGPDQVSNEEDKDDELYGFYISMGLGFFVGFWGVCGSLIFIREWRYTYFKFLNSLNDWLYVRVVLIKRKLTDAQ